MKCKCGKCGNWCDPQIWTSLNWAKKLGINTSIPLCRDCGWLLFNDELKLSDMPKVLQDSLGIDDDNKHH